MDRSTALAVVSRVEPTGWCLGVQERNVRICSLSPFHLKGKNTLSLRFTRIWYTDWCWRHTYLVCWSVHCIPIQIRRRDCKENSPIRGADGKAQIYSLKVVLRLKKHLQRNCRLKLIPLMQGRWQRLHFCSENKLLASLGGKNSKGLVESTKKSARKNWNY